MISVAIHYPKESAEYLTSQFYDAGYSMTQRTDILHVTMSIFNNWLTPINCHQKDTSNEHTAFVESKWEPNFW